MIIAIDGPAASGKGTLAERLAKALGYDRLDTGLLYRAVAWKVLQSKKDDEETAATIAQNLIPKDMENKALKSHEVAMMASKIAQYPRVRKVLLEFQKHFASHPPSKQGAILDGRDIGTVVCPEADIKFYIDATVQERAKRRYKELLESAGDKNEIPIYDVIEKAIAKRDEDDKNRKEAPLKKAKDAIIIHTDGKTPDHVFKEALHHIKERLK